MCTVLEEIPSYKNLYTRFVVHILYNKIDTTDCITTFDSMCTFLWIDEYCHGELYAASANFTGVGKVFEQTLQSMCADPLYTLIYIVLGSVKHVYLAFY